MNDETKGYMRKLKRELDAKSIEIAKAGSAGIGSTSKETEARDRAIFQSGQAFGLWMAAAFLDCMIGDGEFKMMRSNGHHKMAQVKGSTAGVVLDWGAMNVFDSATSGDCDFSQGPGGMN